MMDEEDMGASAMARAERVGLKPGIEWIEWNGGECPVSGYILVDVLWNNQAESKAAPASTWSPQGSHSPTDFWQRPNHPSNQTNSYIIAYRVLRGQRP